ASNASLRRPASITSLRAASPTFCRRRRASTVCVQPATSTVYRSTSSAGQRKHIPTSSAITPPASWSTSQCTPSWAEDGNRLVYILGTDGSGRRRSVRARWLVALQRRPHRLRPLAPAKAIRPRRRRHDPRRSIGPHLGRMATRHGPLVG